MPCRQLGIKPHDAGLVWLYFLLAGGIYLKRALQTLLVTAVLGLVTIAWVTPIAPHWMQELHSNLLAVSAPAESATRDLRGTMCGGPSVIIDLQSVRSRLPR